jgi:hypothetical protein
LGATLTRAQVAKLDEMMQARSPLGQKLAGTMSAFEDAAEGFRVAPTARALGRLSLASRQVGVDLRDAGIAVPAAALRGLVTSVSSSAAAGNE